VSITVLHDQPLMRTLRHVPPGLLPRVRATIDAIIADAPNLPAIDDDAVPETLPALRYARAVPKTAWSVVCSWSIESQTLILRTVNRLDPPF